MSHVSSTPGRRALPAVLFLTGAGLAGTLLLASPAEAAPARPGLTTLTQPGGDTFTARSFGDEWCNGRESRDGHTILQGAKGRWRYAEKAADGTRTSDLLPGALRHPDLLRGVALNRPRTAAGTPPSTREAPN